MILPYAHVIFTCHQQHGTIATFCRFMTGYCWFMARRGLTLLQEASGNLAFMRAVDDKSALWGAIRARRRRVSIVV